MKRKAETVGRKRTYGQRHGLPGKRRGYKTVVQSAPPDPSLNSNSYKNHRSHSELSRPFYVLALQHSQQCISRTLKPGGVVVLEIPYVGLPGPPKPMWTHAVFSSDGCLGWKCGSKTDATIQELFNPTEG